MGRIGRRFFFEECLCNKKIVIYGASETGYAIYLQIQEEEFAEVVAVVDRNADKVKYEYSCPLLTPNKFFNVYGYDYILIASSSISTQQVIKKYMLSNNIEEERIVCLEESFYDGKTEYHMVNNPNIALQQLLNVNQVLVGNIELTKQFQLWMRQYYNRLSNKEEFVCNIRRRFYSDTDYEVKIMLGLYLFELSSYTSDDMKNLICCIRNLSKDKYEWVYYLCIRLTVMELKQNSFLYRELGLNRKELWHKCLDDIGIPTSVTTVKNTNKIAVLVHTLRGDNCSASMIYRTMVNELHRNGKEVKLFVLPYAVNKSFGFLSLTEGEYWKETKEFVDRNRQLIDLGVEIEYIVAKTYKELLTSAIKQVREYQPGCIVDATDEVCPISMLLYKDYPIFNLALRSCTSGTYFTKTSARIFEYNKEVIPYKIELPVVSVMKSQEHHYSKLTHYNIPTESFVIVSVGARLSYELDQEIVDNVIQLLDRNKDMYWIVVGDGAVSRFFSGKRKHGRVKVVEYEEDIMALYELCDVFLNPDRIGGGYSIKFAMQQGVVVVALKKNLRGAASWVGEDELVDGGYIEQCQYIEHLYNDKELLGAKKEKMMERSRRQCNEKEWGIMLTKELDDMMERWEDKNDTI